MSWRDRISNASFRGVPFFVESSSANLSRRTTVHEFPGREDVLVDDMGRGPDRFQIKAYVVGADFDTARDALEAALLTPGAGTLVHPTRGRMSVAIEGEVQAAESRTRLGIADFSFTVVRVTPGALSATPSTGSTLNTAANTVSIAAGKRFTSAFSVLGLPSGFTESAIARVKDAGAALDTARSAISGALGIADSVSGALEDFAEDAESLVNDPALLLGNFQDIAEDVLRAGERAYKAARGAANAVVDVASMATNRRTSRQTLAASATMQAIGGDDAPISEATELSARESSNRKELTSMIRASSLAAISRAAAGLPFTSRQEATAASDLIGAQIEDASEFVDDDTYVAMQNMRVALSAHLASVASTLPEIRTYTVIDDVSVTMLAHWLYGDARRADEIEARNSIRNPALIPAGTTLEVTTS